MALGLPFPFTFLYALRMLGAKQIKTIETVKHLSIVMYPTTSSKIMIQLRLMFFSCVHCLPHSVVFGQKMRLPHISSKV